VGPDVTVAIKGIDDDIETIDDAASVSVPPGGAANTVAAAAAAVAKVGSTANQGQPNIRERSSNASHVASQASVSTSSSSSASSGVEIRLHDCRAVVVRTGVAGAGNTGAETKNAEHWEKAKRRVGFEVEEFLRR
jgi:hypothetical protein